METYTSCRYLKLDSSLGTALNVFPSRYLVGETVRGQETRVPVETIVQCSCRFNRRRSLEINVRVFGGGDCGEHIMTPGTQSQDKISDFTTSFFLPSRLPNCPALRVNELQLKH